ncbi:MAG: IS982 family transposase, partial [Candidatus Marinimicrobia bacterium]|nr:IS982 family transposase [Candidatus Neomarinimicrobiota bacterium]
LSLVAESLSINSENLLFAKLRSEYQEDFPLLIDRSQFNRRRKHLAKFINIVRETLVQKLLPAEDTFILDSMPVEICKFTRAKRIKICKESIETAPEYGYCAAQNTHYFGYKFHGVCSLNGVITSFDLSKANHADIQYLRDIEPYYANCLMLGDKAYLDSEYQLELFETRGIQLNTPMRSNQKNYRRQPALFRKVRKRIETLFSQLVDQFVIRVNYAKTFVGLATRILSKVTAFTLLQFLNSINNKPLNHIKHALA